MARIPAQDLEQLKNEISVQRLVEASGVELKKGGKDFTGICPFHADATASLVITPHKNLWHCFGCQIGGGPIDWVMKIRGVSFRHAVELLKEEMAGGGHSSLAVAPGVSSAAPVKRTTVRTSARSKRCSTGGRSWLTSRSRRRILRWPTDWPTRCWAGRWMSCRRRRAGWWA